MDQIAAKLHDFDKMDIGGDNLDPSMILRESVAISPFYRGQGGILFSGDCVDILPHLKSGIFNTVFADPPFNLGKKYGLKSQDSRGDDEYIEWCKVWIKECARVLAPGGSFFLYNLPRWNILLGPFLAEIGLEFRHWIAIEMKSSLPLPGRLYPAHYSMLYYSKGRASTFHRVRTPIETCRHCNGEIRDYGGHRHAMNPLGVNLKDVWTDIPPVRHAKFKSAKRSANALSTKILDRVVDISTCEGDLVLDPFGGSGTTFAVCRDKRRRWVGIELDFAEVVVERLTTDTIRPHRNNDIVEPPRAHRTRSV